MSTFLCFICHSTVNADTNEETREKYKEVVGMHLCPDSHLCFICCHMMNKLCLFKAVCLKRSLEYPVLFSEKGTLNLKRTEIEYYIFCPDECAQYHNRNMNTKTYHIQNYHGDDDDSNQYAYLADDDKFDDYLPSFITNDKFSNDCRMRDDSWFNYHVNDSIQIATEVNQVNHTLMEQTSSVSKAYEQNRTVHTNVLQDLNETEIYSDVSTNLDHEKNEVEKSSLGKHGITQINNDEQKNVDTNVLQELNAAEVDDDVPRKTNCEETAVDTPNLVKDDLIQNCNDNFKLNNETNSQHVDSNVIKKTRKRGFKKINLSVEEQRTVLERNRRKKKYVEAEFKCYNCALGFLFNDTYQAHMMRHEESNGEHVCPICTLRFASPRSYRGHVSAHSSRLRCKTCDVIISSSPRQKLAHAQTCQGIQDGGDSSACHLCGKVFKSSSSLAQHLRRSFHAKTNRTYSCNVCGRTYNNQAAVRTHMTKHLNRKFNCDQCPSLFSSPYYLNEHKKTHNVGNNEQHYCAICNVSFNSRKNLLAHQRNTSKHQQMAFDCPICSRSYANQRSLASHIETIHSATKHHACSQCDARYSNRKSLVRHMKAHGSRPPPQRAVCYLCGISLSSASKLKRHLKEVCEKSKLEEQLTSYYEQEGIQI